MTRRPRTLLIVLALACLTAVITLAILQPWNKPTSSVPADPLPTLSPTAVQSPPPSTPRSTETTGPEARPGMSLDQDQEHQQTALEAARIMTTWNPSEDLTRTDAELRARHLMSQERAAAITAPQRPASGADWLAAAQADATSSPTVEINHATEGPGVSVIATWEWTTPDSQALPATEESRRIYFFHFNEEGQIDDYTY